MSANVALSGAGYAAGDSSIVRCPLCSQESHAPVVLAETLKRLRTCQVCRVTFIDPLPTTDELTTRFSDRYITSTERIERSFESIKEPILSRVAASIREKFAGGTILDVGCAGGFFLDRYFSSADWVKFGVEPSKYAGAKSIEKGIQIFQGGLAEVHLPAASFDVITALDVLVYFRQPQTELAVMRHALKPGGLLAIVVPLAESQLWRQRTRFGRFAGAARRLTESGHIFFFNPDSLSSALRRAGFEISEILPIPGVRQRHAYEDFLFASYYGLSRAAWRLSGKKRMLGPNFLILANLKES